MFFSRLIEDSIDNCSWGIVISGVFLDRLSHVMSGSEFFSDFSFSGFGRFLQELH